LLAELRPYPDTDWGRQVLQAYRQRAGETGRGYIRAAHIATDRREVNANTGLSSPLAYGF
jgi:hypothetical protein